jgi:hypothetical protein
MEKQNRKLLKDGYEAVNLYGSLQSPQKRLLIGIPMTGLLRSEWVLARYHQVIPANWSQTERIIPLPNWSPINFLVAEARNSIVKAIVEHDFEWLLFIDHDTIIPPNTFLTMNEYMLSKEAPIVSGLYFTRSKPSEPLVYRGRGNSFYKDWKLGDKVWVDGVPMGCTLIHGSILRVLWDESKEYFYAHQQETTRRVFESPQNIFFDPETMNWYNTSGTEDLEFCRRVIEDNIFEKAGWPEFQKKKFPFLIDTSIFCKHVDWDGKQYPIAGEEYPHAVCKIGACEEQAVATINNFYWCKRHLPERFKVKRETGGVKREA